MSEEDFLELCITDPEAATKKFMQLQTEMDQIELDYYESAAPLDFDDDDIPF
jgi:hypothetical protein